MARKQSYREAIKHRDDLTGEHRLGDAGQFLFALIFAAVWIPDTFIFHYTTCLNNYVPGFIRIPIGIVLLLLSGYLAIAGLSIVFGEKRDKPVVIRKSVFNMVRHPIYLSEILLYLGLIMFSISLVSIFVLLCAFLFLHAISRYEEKLLRVRFGEAYDAYMQEVPMWIPKLGKKGE